MGDAATVPISKMEKLRQKIQTQQNCGLSTLLVPCQAFVKLVILDFPDMTLHVYVLGLTEPRLLCLMVSPARHPRKAKVWATVLLGPTGGTVPIPHSGKWLFFKE